MLYYISAYLLKRTVVSVSEYVLGILKNNKLASQICK